MVAILSPAKQADMVCLPDNQGGGAGCLLEGLRALGYNDGRNVALEYRLAEGAAERLPALAAELVALRPDVIYTYTTVGANAAAAATKTIPIVVGPAAETTMERLAGNFARPVGNVTGLTLNNVGQDEKLLQMLKELAPRIVRVALLANPDNPGLGSFLDNLRPAAKQLGIRLNRIDVRTSAKEAVTLKPIFDQMRSLGWIEGQTIRYDRAFAYDRHEVLPRLATELVARKPELVYALPLITARAAWQATRTIPMVFATASDPVREGFVASLGRPGGNATGLSNTSASLLPKRNRLLLEILPGVKRIGRLLDPADSSGRQARQKFAPAAASLGLTITMAEPAEPAGFEAEVAELLAARVDAIYAASVLPLNMRGRLIELANQTTRALLNPENPAPRALARLGDTVRAPGCQADAVRGGQRG